HSCKRKCGSILNFVIASAPVGVFCNSSGADLTFATSCRDFLPPANVKSKACTRLGNSHLPKINLSTPGQGVKSLMGREQASHASRPRAGRSRQRQSKWARSTVHRNGAGNSAVSY